MFTAVRRIQLAPGVGAWLVTGYAEARAAMADPRVGKDSTRLAEVFTERGAPGYARIYRQPGMANMLYTDPPAHSRLRGLVQRAFTLRRVEQLRPTVTAMADRLLDTIAGQAEVDLLAEFAVPLPTVVICALLGVPPEDQSEFRAWTNVFVSTAPIDEVRRASAEMNAYMRELVARKRAEPADDLISALVVDDGDQLTEQELVAMADLLLTAGHETTVNLIGNGTLALLTHPDQLAALRADRGLLRAAIEELLRFDGPVSQATVRYTREPLPLGEVTIPANEIVLVNIDGANHDPRHYPDPDRLDITRPPAGHLGFGHGVHFCLGAQLARMEAEVAFTGLLDRFPGCGSRSQRPNWSGTPTACSCADCGSCPCGPTGEPDRPRPGPHRQRRRGRQPPRDPVG
ncbi:cytochrome P450 [Kibdelosporangium lantanae]